MNLIGAAKLAEELSIPRAMEIVLLVKTAGILVDGRAHHAGQTFAYSVLVTWEAMTNSEVPLPTAIIEVNETMRREIMQNPSNKSTK